MKFIWHGINKSFDKKAKKLNVFENERWLKKQTLNLSRVLQSQEQDDNYCNYSEYCLSIIAASIKKKKISILDYGGGIGEEYFKIKKSVANKKIKFFLLEKKEIVELLKREGLNNEIVLLTKIKKNIKIDIIHFGSSFHYIEDWKLILKECMKCKPEFFIFADILCGDIARTFSTNQIYYKKKIPIWIYKEEDIVKFLEANNYQVSYRSNFKSEFISNHKNILPMANFPKELRIKYPRQLLFKIK